MTKIQYALVYNTCTTAELKRFILDRTGTTIKSQRRSAHIEILEEADENATFRFLDLISQLRNKIYWELLNPPGRSVFTPRWKQCWPQILRTCKQIESEANGILYADHHAWVYFHCGLNKSWLSSTSIKCLIYTGPHGQPGPLSSKDGHASIARRGHPYMTKTHTQGAQAYHQGHTVRF